MKRLSWYMVLTFLQLLPDAAIDATVDLSNRNLRESDFHHEGTAPQLPLNSQNINLSRNRLKCIPDQLLGFASLIHLDVSRNALQGFPSEIKLLTNLVTLNALSNHLRMNKMPAEELASLKHLKLLDLRYNRKLKQAALTSLEEALMPNNPQLEIRCTVPSSPAELEGQDSNKKTKFSTCDRDATLLQSQIEPLSTPQLTKRLERSFGVTIAAIIAAPRNDASLKRPASRPRPRPNCAPRCESCIPTARGRATNRRFRERGWWPRRPATLEEPAAIETD